MKRRPLYLANQDTVQDAINEHGKGGITIRQIMERTKLSYAAVHQATVDLRNRGRIRSEIRNRTLYLYPNHTKA